MRQLWVYGMSLLITGVGIGGTLYFFLKSPREMPSEQRPAYVEENYEKIEPAQPVDAPSPGAPEAPSQVQDSSLAEVRELKSRGELVKAKQILLNMLQNAGSSARIQAVEQEYWDTNVKLIFSPLAIEGWTDMVTVKKGDSLSLLAGRYKTTPELLAESNGIEGALIHPGQKLRVLTGKISVLVDKSLNTLALKINGEIVKIYRVGTGVGGSTPVGDFKIANKIMNPPWHHEGKVVPFGNPENILGTRWMGFDFKGYGIHGTWDPGSVGSQSSAGCVRLKNDEVEELYKIVPQGSSVTIVE